MNGYSFKITLVFLLAFLLTKLSYSQVVSPYTIKWYEASDDPTMTGASKDSVVSQYAIKGYLTDNLNQYWLPHTNGIYYSIKNVGLGMTPHLTYRLSISSVGSLGIYQSANTAITNRYTLTSPNISWQNEITDIYKITVEREDVFTINSNSLENSLVIDSYGIGIRNATPTQPLDVTGNIKLSGYLYAPGLRALTNNNILTYNTAGEFGYQNIYTIIGDSIHWRTDGTHIFQKNLARNVGIGTIAPSEKLTISGLDNVFTKIKSTGSGSDAGFILENDQIAWYFYNKGDAQNSFRIVDNTNVKVPFVIESNAPHFTTYLDDTGNVGFGKSTPQYKIDVAGYGSFDNSVYLQAAPNINVPDTLLALDGKLIKKTAVTFIYQYIDTNYAPIGDTTLWTLIPDTIAGDYKTGDYADGDYLLASVDGYAIINKGSYNVKTTDNLSVKENLSVVGEITSGGSAVSRWRGVLIAAPLTDIKEGDMFYQSTDEKVYIRANLNWKPLN